MKVLDKKTASDLTKLVIFMVVTILATGLLAVLIGIAAIVGMTFLGKTANNRLNNITDAIK